MLGTGVLFLGLFVVLFLAYDAVTVRSAYRRGWRDGVRRACGHHEERNLSDTTYCTRCEQSWDINDPDPPPCFKPSPFDPVKL